MKSARPCLAYVTCSGSCLVWGCLCGGNFISALKLLQSVRGPQKEERSGCRFEVSQLCCGIPSSVAGEQLIPGKSAFVQPRCGSAEDGERARCAPAPRGRRESSALWTVTGTTQPASPPRGAPADTAAVCPGASPCRCGAHRGRVLPSTPCSQRAGRRPGEEDAEEVGGNRALPLGRGALRGAGAGSGRAPVPPSRRHSGSGRRRRRSGCELGSGHLTRAGSAAAGSAARRGTAPSAIAPQPGAIAALYGMWLVTFFLLYSLRKGTWPRGRLGGGGGVGHRPGGVGLAPGAEPQPGVPGCRRCG